MPKKDSSSTSAVSRFIPITIFLVVSLATFGGITYLAPTLGAGEIPTIEALGESGTLTALHGALSVLAGFLVLLFGTLAMMPRRNVDKSKIPPYPRYPAMNVQGDDADGNSGKRPRGGRYQPIPIPQEAREATYSVETRADDTEVLTITVKGMSGAQFKKKSGLRSKLQKIAGIKWQHPKNSAEEKTITMAGTITSAEKESVLAAVEKLAAPQEPVEV